MPISTSAMPYSTEGHFWYFMVYRGILIPTVARTINNQEAMIIVSKEKT